MPPPTAADAWLTGRRFGVVIDAGSSGSRLQIYSWKDARLARSDPNAGPLDTLPRVEKGTQGGEDWSYKAEPGISSFGDDPEGVAAYLAPLLAHARTHIPPALQSETPLFLLATAGMRLLSPQQQADVLQATCHFLKFHSNFRIDDPSPAGPCGSSVRIITGEEEGLFGWIAVNYLMDGFAGPRNNMQTYGFLDMGGASTQIAFEPGREEREKASNLIDVRLRLLNGHEVNHQVFVTTWLGYGTNQARERYVGQTILDHEANHRSSTFDVSLEKAVLDPCLPKELRLTESPTQLEDVDTHSTRPHMLVGTGSFEQCLERTLPLLNKDAPCPDTHCLFNGVYVPPIDFSASHFIGVSEYWYSSEHVFGLGGAYDVVQYERAASEFCARDWADIMKEHQASREHGQLGGDGQVEENGHVIDVGRWGNNVEIPRLQMQCFKAAWLVNVLHEGIGMPRIVDPGGNGTTTGDKVEEQAQNKGLGRPVFQSLDTVGDIAISWTLGKMVLEASKEVPPLSNSVPQLHDPLDAVELTDDSPIHPIRPPFLDFDAIEDQIAHRLPSSLTRQTLGFSPVTFLFYVFVVSMMVLVMYRLRHRLRSTVRRFHKKNRYNFAEDYAMEEAQPLKSPSPLPWSPSASRLSFQVLQPLRSLSSTLGSRAFRPPPIQIHSHHSPVRSNHFSPVRTSPIRSLSAPAPRAQNGLTASDVASGSATAFVPGSPRLDDGGIVSVGSVSSLSSRSRNSSQMNLTSLAARQTISRTNSTMHVQPGGSIRYEH
ncbi:hypothetical protein CERSUDRAFT_113288 [Gelatoporia subvermispora B]|uniref:Golgi apyrase n=1 Tax=Ceriporiopsis subvermispora (strain B) TaxID=914234 RepID=M2QM70_CERS8|nr:hypothetical protein CERSUDRAFT_113288 [Gelatoporia subvermispora B]